MNKLTIKLLGVLGFGALAVGCAGGDFEPVVENEAEPLGMAQQPLCENKGGTNAVMTALAVATGRELRRWLPERDFQWNASKGMLELSQSGSSRCPNGVCANTQAMLDMQKPEANGKVIFPGNIKLDSNLLKQLLKSGWDAQMSCNASGACAAPSHDLKYTHVESGSCDKKFFFDPLRSGSSTWLSSTDADRLKNKLKFVGYPGNKMLNFYMRDGQVSVDPTYGLNSGVTTKVGSCDAACTKFSPSSVSGACCSCNGATRKYIRSAFNASTYLCAG